MASVASPARVPTSSFGSFGPGSGAMTQHGSQLPDREGYQHPPPQAQPSDITFSSGLTPSLAPALAAAPLEAVRIQSGSVGESAYFHQGEPQRFQAGGFFRRAAAAAVDLTLLLPVCSLAGVLLCLAFGQPIPRLAELSPDLLIAALLDSNAASEAMLALSAVLFFVYFSVFHAASGKTPGKRLLGLRVIDA